MHDTPPAPRSLGDPSRCGPADGWKLLGRPARGEGSSLLKQQQQQQQQLINNVQLGASVSCHLEGNRIRFCCLQQLLTAAPFLVVSTNPKSNQPIHA